jgi:hypothetical protein
MRIITRRDTGLLTQWTFGRGALDADALAFINAAGITDRTEQSAVNTLVSSLKSFGLWTKMQAIYPFVGGTAASHKFNLKNPQDTNAAFRLLFLGGWTHSSGSNGGALPNGTNAYAISYFSPSVQQTVNSNGMGIYVTQYTVAGADPVQIGNFTAITQASTISATPILLNSRLNATIITSAISGGAGSFDTQRTSATVTTIYKNGSAVATGNSGGTLPNDINGIFLGNLSLNNSPYATGYNNSQFRFAYFSQGLNSTEVANVRTAVQNFQTSLSRQI